MSVFLLPGERGLWKDYEYLCKHLDEQQGLMGQSESNLIFFFFTLQTYCMRIAFTLLLHKIWDKPVTFGHSEMMKIPPTTSRHRSQSHFHN